MRDEEKRGKIPLMMIMKKGDRKEK